MSTNFRLFLVALPLVTATPALAQDAAGAADPLGDSITIGAAGVYLPDYEGSDDYRWTPAPAAIGSVGGFNFALLGNRASIDLIPSDGPIDIQLGPVGVVNFNRTDIDSIDDPRVRALGERDTAIELGGYVGIGKTGVFTSPYDRLSVSLSYRHDVTDTHDSHVWTPSITYLTPLSTKAAATVFASADRVGNGYAQTYFGITPAEAAASGLPAFTARDGWKSYTLGAAATVALTGDLLHGLKLVAGGTYSRMLNDFGDSPITSVAGRRAQWIGGAGLAYTF